MFEWPPIAEPELLRRMAMDDGEFSEFVRATIAQLPPRVHGPESLALALGYPWSRPAGSYLLAGEQIEPLAEMAPRQREQALARFSSPESGRLPVLAIGSNGAPEVAARKFADFADERDRSLLALRGHLHGFDVGVAAQPTMYGSLPATLFPSPGTAVRAALLWVTPAQFTQLAWSEISYRLGRLGTRFEVDEGGAEFGEVLVFVSRFGAFSPAGEPVALAAVSARGRSAPAFSQEQLLDAAARLALGPDAVAEDLVRAIFEEPGELLPKLSGTLHPAAQPFRSERWTPYPG
jgi:hypothetical protein